MQLLMLPVQILRSELIVWRILFLSRFNLHIPCISIPKTCKHKVSFADFRLIYSYDLVVPEYIAIFSWIPALTVRHSDSPLSGTQVQVAQLTNTKIKTSRLSWAMNLCSPAAWQVEQIRILVRVRGVVACSENEEFWCQLSQCNVE